MRIERKKKRKKKEIDRINEYYMILIKKLYKLNKSEEENQ